MLAGLFAPPNASTALAVDAPPMLFAFIPYPYADYQSVANAAGIANAVLMATAETGNFALMIPSS
jgi:hypothetical protein